MMVLVCGKERSEVRSPIWAVRSQMYNVEHLTHLTSDLLVGTQNARLSGIVNRAFWDTN